MIYSDMESVWCFSNVCLLHGFLIYYKYTSCHHQQQWHVGCGILLQQNALLVNRECCLLTQVIVVLPFLIVFHVIIHPALW